MMRRLPHGSRAGTRLDPPRLRRRGFTLIELLTVISIIALLISILLPSLNRARIQAKRTASKALLHGIDTGLEMFRTETDEYPESGLGLYYGDASEPQENNSANGLELTGAQKLARALMGPEAGAGIPIGSVAPKTLREAGGSTDSFYTDPNPAQRIGPYMDSAQRGKHYMRAKELRGKIPGDPPSGIPPDGAVFIDSFKYPVLYWKSEGRGSFMAQAVRGDVTGYYYQQDNLPFLKWPFGAWPHQILDFGDPVRPDNTDPTTNTFSRMIHQHGPEDDTMSDALAKLRKPFNPNTFLLVSPGFDGIYGTNDDVKNFNQ